MPFSPLHLLALGGCSKEDEPTLSPVQPLTGYLMANFMSQVVPKRLRVQHRQEICFKKHWPAWSLLLEFSHQHWLQQSHLSSAPWRDGDCGDGFVLCRSISWNMFQPVVRLDHTGTVWGICCVAPFRVRGSCCWAAWHIQNHDWVLHSPTQVLVTSVVVYTAPHLIASLWSRGALLRLCKTAQKHPAIGLHLWLHYADC